MSQAAEPVLEVHAHLAPEAAPHGDSRPDLGGENVVVTRKTRQFFGDDVELGNILTPGAVEDHFKVKEVLGVGRFGEVRKGVHKLTGRKCALKFVDKAETTHRRFLREAQLLRRLGRHPNVIEFLGVYVNKEDTHYVLATEYASGGSLANFVGIDVWRAYNEAEICIVMYQMACAVSHLHRHRVVHCDIKHENFVSIDRVDVASAKALENHALKLTDFGCAVEVLPGTMKAGGGGTVVYMAPERLRGDSFSFPADVWSLGVVFFSLLTSRLPFYGHDETEVLAQTERQEWRAAVTNCVDISPEAVDLLGAMLALDPAQRITADQILETDWAKGLAPATEPVRETIQLLRKAYLRFKFRAAVRTAMAGNRLKMVLTAVHTEKLTLQLLSYLSTPDQIRQLSAAFYGHATPPGTEWITKAAFVNTLMSSLSLRSPKLASDLFDSSVSASSLFAAGSGSGSGSELTVDRRGSRSWRLLFDVYAASPMVRKKSGRGDTAKEEPRINHLVFCLSVASKLSVSADEKLGLAFELFDTDHRGHIDFAEYREMMRTLFYGGMGSLDELQDTAVIQEMRAAFDAADQDKDGVLNKREFVEAGKNNPQLKRYFQSLHRILPRKQSLFVPEDSVVRESQQGMLQVKIRAFLRRSRWRECMCAMVDGRLGMWPNYEAFVTKEPQSTIPIDNRVRVEVYGLSPDSPLSATAEEARRVVLAANLSSILETTLDVDETTETPPAPTPAPATEPPPAGTACVAPSSRQGTRASIATVDGAQGPRLVLYKGKRLLLKIEAHSPIVLRAWADVFMAHGATINYAH